MPRFGNGFAKPSIVINMEYNYQIKIVGTGKREKHERSGVNARDALRKVVGYRSEIVTSYADYDRAVYTVCKDDKIYNCTVTKQ